MLFHFLCAPQVTSCMCTCEQEARTRTQHEDTLTTHSLTTRTETRNNEQPSLHSEKVLVQHPPWRKLRSRTTALTAPPREEASHFSLWFVVGAFALIPGWLNCFVVSVQSHDSVLRLFSCSQRAGSYVYVCPHPLFEHLAMGQTHIPPTRRSTHFVTSVLSCPIWPRSHRMCVIARRRGCLHRLAHAAGCFHQAPPRLGALFSLLKTVHNKNLNPKIGGNSPSDMIVSRASSNECLTPRRGPSSVSWNLFRVDEELPTASIGSREPAPATRLELPASELILGRELVETCFVTPTGTTTMPSLCCAAGNSTVYPYEIAAMLHAKSMRKVAT